MDPRSRDDDESSRRMRISSSLSIRRSQVVQVRRTRKKFSSHITIDTREIFLISSSSMSVIEVVRERMATGQRSSSTSPLPFTSDSPQLRSETIMSIPTTILASPSTNTPSPKGSMMDSSRHSRSKESSSISTNSLSRVEIRSSKGKTKNESILLMILTDRLSWMNGQTS